MPPSRPRKSEEPTVADLEHGRPTQSVSSLAIAEAESSQTDIPETRRSLEYADSTSHNYIYSKWWRKTVDKVPQPIARVAGKAVQWAKGPRPPQIYYIKPLLEPVQTFPIRGLSRIPKLARIGLLAVLFLLWIVLFGVILSKFGLPTNIGGFGAPVRLSCIARLWYAIHTRKYQRDNVLRIILGQILRVADSTVGIASHSMTQASHLAVQQTVLASKS